MIPEPTVIVWMGEETFQFFELMVPEVVLQGPFFLFFFEIYQYLRKDGLEWVYPKRDIREENKMISQKKKYSVNTMTKVSILSVIAFIVMFIEAPIFIFPGFLKIDLSDVPALIAGFSLGPAAGIAVELLKNLLHLLRTSTGGVGEVANFVIGAALVAPAAIVYSRKKDRIGALTGLSIGIVAMSIVGALANYFVLIPFYQNFMPLDAIIGMSAAANGAIVDIKTLILYGIIPFNLFKGLVVAVVTMLLYKRISPLLK